MTRGLTGLIDGSFINKVSMTDAPQSWETEEEATAALHSYAKQYAEREEDPSVYEQFLGGHQVLEIKQGTFVLALKPGFMPFSFT